MSKMKSLEAKIAVTKGILTYSKVGNPRRNEREKKTILSQYRCANKKKKNKANSSVSFAFLPRTEL